MAGPQLLFKKQADDKIEIVGNSVIVACTGSVGLGQRVNAIVKGCWDEKIFQKSAVDCSKEISRRVGMDFQNTGLPRHPQTGLNFGVLLAAPLESQAQLVEFDTINFQPEIKKEKSCYVAIGSGQILAEPFLAFISRVLWKDAVPDVKLGMFGVYWALSHTIQYAPFGIGAPAHLAVLRREAKQWSVQRFDEPDLQETREHIADIEGKIGAAPAGSIKEAVAEEPPKPPTS
jgi:hypothetical protein